jgi:glutamate dehydrogenase (NADP+)
MPHRKVLKDVLDKSPGEKEFHQAVTEVFNSLGRVLDNRPQYLENHILHRITEPERVIMFRVPWVDDEGGIWVNRGYRV